MANDAATLLNATGKLSTSGVWPTADDVIQQVQAANWFSGNNTRKTYTVAP